MKTPIHCKKFMILRHYERKEFDDVGHYCFQCRKCGELSWQFEQEG